MPEHYLSDREQIWSRLDENWDILIIGGGITGAGILNEASKLGYKTLLLEQYDFAAGTSSRSSKLVHGGFRYLKNGQFRITLDSVKEREKLLREGRGLIHPLNFLFVNKKGDSTPGYMFGFGLILYGLMAGKWLHRHYSPEEMKKICLGLNFPDLQGGYGYYDAQTDDARLTLRIISDAIRFGGAALNYARVRELLITKNGQVRGVVVEDLTSNGKGTKEILSKVVVNATGPWADKLRKQVGRPARIRPLRGSHLAFSQKDLPLNCAISLLHPRDGRSVFIFPWENITIVGTTDVDTRGELPKDPYISQNETEYLLELVHFTFPELQLDAEDVISTWAGIRPVINTGKADPSKESREHVIWDENGLVTVTGGKLTTFRVMAHQALKIIQKKLGNNLRISKNAPIFTAVNNYIDDKTMHLLSLPEGFRLAGRYGLDALQIIIEAQQYSFETVADTEYLWAEIRWALKHEGVVHLDDLLLRRVRIGLLTKDGGESVLRMLKDTIQEELGWNDLRWENEYNSYLQTINNVYRLNR